MNYKTQRYRVFLSTKIYANPTKIIILIMIISVFFLRVFVSWCSKIFRWTEGAELTDGREGFGGRMRGMRGTEGAVLEGAFYNGKDTAKFVDSQK